MQQLDARICLTRFQAVADGIPLHDVAAASMGVLVTCVVTMAPTREAALGLFDAIIEGAREHLAENFQTLKTEANRVRRRAQH